MQYPIVIVDTSTFNAHIAALPRPVILMVKANAYGLGLRQVVLSTPSAFGYGVATWEEGEAVRKLTDKPILVTSPVTRAGYGLTPMVGDMQSVDCLPRGTKVHLKINTGMNRYGVSPDRAPALAQKCIKRGLQVTGIATHYASALSARKQNEAFVKAVLAVEGLTGRLVRHTEATSTHANLWFDMVRLGLGAYSGGVEIMSVVLAVREVREGASVGYDGIYVMPKTGLVAIVAGGYADGLSKGLIGGLMKGRDRLHKIVAVCMDVVILHLACPLAVGDEVTLVECDHYSRYELYTGLGGRTRFEYARGSTTCQGSSEKDERGGENRGRQGHSLQPFAR